MRKKYTKGRNIKCDFCNIEFHEMNCMIEDYKTHFCSKKCFLSSLKAKSFNFKCSICDKVVFTQPAQMRLRNRKTCSIKCRSIMQTKLAKERRKSGLMTKHQIDRCERYSKEAEEWRKKVFERDDYTCQSCGERGGYIEADHCLPWAFFPDLRYELLNGRTLCRPCHNKTKISYKEMRKMYV